MVQVARFRKPNNNVSRTNHHKSMMETILLIDRDHVRRKGYANALLRDGFKVSSHESGSDGLNHLVTHPVNGVVLEYNSGFEQMSPLPAGGRIVEEIVDCDAFLPLAVICDRGDVLDAQTAAAADLVLRHPVEPRTLLDSLKDLLREPLRVRAQRKSNCVFVFR